jgi:hypothetical protein
MVVVDRLTEIAEKKRKEETSGTSSRPGIARHGGPATLGGTVESSRDDGGACSC